jgi:hypothetical protein
MPLSRLQAIKQLSQYVQADLYPELDVNQLGNLIDSHRRFRTWEPETFYNVGDMIVPTVPNGRFYQCIIAGNSRDTEPSWPTVGYQVGQCFFEYQQQYYNEGWGLTWQDNGFITQEIYDVRAAAREGWMLKASIAANLANTNDGKMSIELHIIQENCIQMAAKYRSFFIL